VLPKRRRRTENAKNGKIVLVAEKNNSLIADFLKDEDGFKAK